MIQLLLTLALCGVSNALMSVGWYVQGSACSEIMPDNFPYQYYSHILVGSLKVFDNGTAYCDVSDLILKRFTELAPLYNSRVLMREGIVNTIMFQIVARNASWDSYRANYLASVRSAVVACNGNGLEYDFEFDTVNTNGIVSVDQMNSYTEFLADVKVALGNDMNLGCNIGTKCLSRPCYPLLQRPWVNSSMVNNNVIDYVNIMSYHASSNVIPWLPLDTSIDQWKNDKYLMVDIYGFNPSQINLGIGFYSYNLTYNEPNFCQISSFCPNIYPQLSYCHGQRFVSKAMNYNIGKYIKDTGFGGFMVFSANFDSLSDNNTLVAWTYAGMISS